MPIYIDKDDDITPYIVGIKLSNGTKYEFNYETLKNRPCFNDEDAIETYLDETVIPAASSLGPYLTFSSDAPFTLGIVEDGDWKGKGWNGHLEYSTDLDTWTSLWNDYPYSAISSGADNKLYLRGINNTTFSENFCTIFNITATTGVECYGNIETLLDYQTVMDGKHPAMGSYCYSYMFYNCTSLTTAPELPATTLTEGCYDDMFSGCTSLTTPPQLPATALAKECYFYMFDGCTSLTTAPELPATILVADCYNSMFRGCTSLTAASTLPATTLAADCYNGMFDGCTSLTAIPELPATTLADRCYAGMFSNCTSLTATPELPATTLEDSCYLQMFSGCTSLTSAPQLLATTLAVSCYYGMFSGCTSLPSYAIPVLPATTLVPGCYGYMFQNCERLGFSETQDNQYIQPYRIPSEGTGIDATDALTGMFAGTSGTFTGTPIINTTYYTYGLV